MQFGAPGIVPGAVQGKQRKHAAVPIAHALAGRAAIFVLDVKAPAGRTHKGAGPAIDARKRHFFPEGRIIQIGGVGGFQVVRIYQS